MKRAVAYCRVSTKGQTGEDKFGIESQRDMISEYCEKNGIEIVNWYIDEGISGAERHRPALDRLLEGEVTNPPVQCVIVAKADRMARDINLYHVLKYKLDQMDLELISVKEDWSAQDKLTAMILETFIAMVAAVEKENIRIRMSGGRKQKAKRGGYAGGRAPMGYKIKDGQLVINEDEAPVVRRLFELKHSGTNMLNTMRKLNEEGYRTRNGKEFVISTVQSIWNNEPTYRGMYRYGKDGEWVKGQQEPILKDDK
jgi:site-specific DNA recombinase